MKEDVWIYEVHLEVLGDGVSPRLNRTSELLLSISQCDGIYWNAGTFLALGKPHDKRRVLVKGGE
jgi:hypothetical protein